jgi:hypothetical protein
MKWWKKVMLHKYLARDRLRCLDGTPQGRIGSPIWRLLKASLPLFQSKVTWIPGNGRKISIWDDSILGNPPLQQDPSLTPLFNWFQEHGLNTLFDISKWNNSSGSWSSWKFNGIP